MKCDKNGKVIDFEVGDVFNDLDGIEYGILHVDVSSIFGGEDWISLQRHPDNTIMLAEPNWLFQYNQLNKSFA